MKINEILNYHKDQQLFQHIGDAFLPNGELKFPVDFGSLAPDADPMLDQTVDEVPDEIMDVATVDQRPQPIGQTPCVGGNVPHEDPGTSVLGHLLSTPRMAVNGLPKSNEVVLGSPRSAGSARS